MVPITGNGGSYVSRGGSYLSHSGPYLSRGGVLRTRSSVTVGWVGGAAQGQAVESREAKMKRIGECFTLHSEQQAIADQPEFESRR